MSHAEPSAEEIQRQMAKLRGALEQEAQGVVSSAQTLSDWRYHFRAHPGLFCAVAATIGFVLVPRGAKPAPPASAPPVDSTGESRVQAAERKSLMAVALGMAANVVARQATAIVAARGREFVESFLAARASQRSRETAAEVEPSNEPREVS
jgi:hypothetical protein